MVQAIIFDLDGTVVDSEGLWEEVFSTVARNRQIPNPKPGKWIHEAGVGILPNWERLVGKGEKAESLARETWNLYSQETKKEEVRVREGLVELVEFIKEQGWLTGLATGSNWNVVEQELEQLDMYLAFDVTTTGEEVLAQKPDPEIYLLTAQKMGVAPAECVVMEDSVAGVTAAIEAGCRVVGITSDYASGEQLRAAGATFVVDNLRETVVLLREHGNKESN